MLQGFDNGEISIGQVRVLANHCDVDFLCQLIETVRHGSPVCKKARFVTINVEDVAEPLLFEHEWNVVDVRNIVGRKDSIWMNMAECREFLSSFIA